MKQKIALITGATSGIGYSAAKQLVQDGWSYVIVTGRSQPRVDEVVSKLKADTGTQNITGLVLDLDSFGSVKKAVAELVMRDVPIDFLVLNAGLIPGKKRVVTSEKLESSQAPLVGHHQLTLGLLAAGLVAPDARIVIAGSEAARGDVPLFRYTNLATFSEKAFGGDRAAGAEAILRGSSKVNYNANTAYADAKVFVAWWVAVLARKIPEQMGVYAISPGSTPDTQGLRSGSFMLRHVMVPILRLLPGMTQTPEEAAKRYLAAINFGVEDSGKFFASPPKKMTVPIEVMRQEHFHDRANQDALWRAIVNVSGVDA
jgi:NAD(P)-dependent dehydrogenase (short-subunit alcohol dehydrogenase family)